MDATPIAIANRFAPALYVIFTSPEFAPVTAEAVYVLKIFAARPAPSVAANALTQQLKSTAQTKIAEKICFTVSILQSSL